MDLRALYLKLILLTIFFVHYLHTHSYTPKCIIAAFRRLLVCSRIDDEIWITKSNQVMNTGRSIVAGEL
jgi:hypothetical protein